MSVLMRSVSGIRGIVGESLTPPMLMEYLNAFIQITQAKKVVIGRDTRPTGPMIEALIAQGCRAAGVESVMLGVASTPTVEMMVPHLGADGGIIITASHNPIQWNALKFLDSEGIFLKEEDIKKLFDLVDNKRFKWADYQGLADFAPVKGGDTFHITQTLALPYIHLNAIKKRKFRVAVDAVNGAGCSIVPALLNKLGCEVVEINTEPSGIFNRNPEPVPESLKALGKLVKEKGCDVGFATDPDADRCAIVSEKGQAIGEEYTLVLGAHLVLKHKKGPITVNLSTSRMNEDLADLHGVVCHRSKVGEINVSSVMMENGSVVGGEGNGGLILPELHYGRDGILAVAMTLQLMLEENKSISELVKRFPAYKIVKKKVPIQGTPLSLIVGRLIAKFHNVKRNEEDGLRFEWDKKWVHIRASNTEPVIRVIAEAPTLKEAESLCEEVISEAV